MRVLAELDTRAFRLHHSVGEDSVTVVTRTWVTRDLLSRFVQTAADLVRAWPPEPAPAARRTLKLVMPEFDGDPVVLLQRLLPSVCTTAGGALFQPPVTEAQAVQYVLVDARPPLTRADLQARVDHVFAGTAPAVPPLHRLPPLLDGTGWKVVGNDLVRAETAAPRPPAPPGDDIRALLSLDTTVEPRDRVRDVLRQAARQGSSFRLVVVPPARHREIGESLVTQLGATGIDLTDAWFQQHAATLATDARAARFAALKVATGKRMDALLSELVNRHGAPGRTVVVHNTGLLEALGGLEQVRLLYDRVQGQAAGFWVLVVPGLILDRQPRFNNRTPIWHQPGLVLPLDEPLRG